MGFQEVTPNEEKFEIVPINLEVIREILKQNQLILEQNARILKLLTVTSLVVRKAE
jgi:hypothetical protein